MKRDKTKDIIESVLPATRNGADSARKDKAATKRAGRRKIGMRVRGIRGYEDYMDEASDLEFYPDTEINYIRDRRRDFDNLGALLRWARYHCDHQLKDLCEEDKYNWFKNILPNSLQGRHALGHIKDACLELNDEYRLIYSDEYWEGRRKEYRDTKQREYDEVYAMVVRVLTEGYHKRYNAMLKRNQLDPFVVWLSDMSKEMVPKRVLGGWHDVDNFVAWLIKQKATRPRFGLAYTHYPNNFVLLTKKFFEDL